MSSNIGRAGSRPGGSPGVRAGEGARRAVRLRLALAALAAAAWAVGAPAAQAVVKKGFCGRGGVAAVNAVEAGWYYTWSLSAYGQANAQFVPMLFDKTDVTAANLNKIEEQKTTLGVQQLLGFNEPERDDLHIGTSVAEAIALWPQFESTDLTLISPAPSIGSEGQAWLDNFMTQAENRGYRVNAVGYHNYISTAGSTRYNTTAADTFISQTTSFHNRYGKPVWITEFGDNRIFGGGSDLDENFWFLWSALPRLESLSWVSRYAWYSADSAQHGFLNDGELTSIGVLYKAHDIVPALLDTPDYATLAGYTNRPEKLIYGMELMLVPRLAKYGIVARVGDEWTDAATAAQRAGSNGLAIAGFAREGHLENGDYPANRWVGSGSSNWHGEANWAPDSPVGGPGGAAIAVFDRRSYARMPIVKTTTSVAQLWLTRHSIAVTIGDGGFTLGLNGYDGVGVDTSVGGAALTIDTALSLGAGMPIWAVGSKVNANGAISGSGGLTKTGPGILTLAGPCTYTGGTVVDAGTLKLSGGANRLKAGSDIVVSGLLDLNGQAQAFGSLTGGGAVETGGGALTVGQGNATAEFSGVIRHTTATALTKSGSGAFTLSGGGDNANLAATVTAGTLVLNKGSGAGVHALGSGMHSVSGGALRLDGTGGDQIQNGGSVAVAAGGALDVNGRGETIAGLSLAGDGDGSGALFNGGGAAATLTVTDGIALAADCSIGGGGDLTLPSPIRGGGRALTKVGLGTLTLSGANTYSGGTSVNKGTLRLDGALAGGAVIVQNGGTLAGTGSIGGPVTIRGNGTLAPGNSIGSLTISNTLELMGTTVMEVNKATGANDVVRGLTAVTYGGALVVTNLAGTLAAGDTFRLFAASSATGAFESIGPPPGPDLEWRFSPSNGTLAAVGVTNVPPLPASYGAWAAGITNGLTNAQECATGDGYPNLLKYATGSSPTAPDILARLEADRSNGVLALRFNRNPAATDLTLVVQGSYSTADGAGWGGLATNIAGSWRGATNVQETAAPPAVSVTVWDRVADATNRFLRLQVTRP